MCTVTYVPLAAGFVLTSSRDEKINRCTLPPAVYEHDGQKIIYPKDKEAGGSWLAVNKQNQIACLLNGAFRNHKKKNTYQKSRGQVLIESFQYQSMHHFKEQIDLSGVEPFTLLTLKKKEFYESRWDGDQLHVKKIAMNKPAIWSSATLYDQKVREKREKWFYYWLNKHKTSADFNIDQFHTSRHGFDPESDILMERPSGLQTLSVSRIRLENKESSFRYSDLQNNKAYNIFLT